MGPDDGVKRVEGLRACGFEFEEARDLFRSFFEVFHAVQCGVAVGRRYCDAGGSRGYEQ